MDCSYMGNFYVEATDADSLGPSNPNEMVLASKDSVYKWNIKSGLNSKLMQISSWTICSCKAMRCGVLVLVVYYKPLFAERAGRVFLVNLGPKFPFNIGQYYKFNLNLIQEDYQPKRIATNLLPHYCKLNDNTSGLIESNGKMVVFLQPNGILAVLKPIPTEEIACQQWFINLNGTIGYFSLSSDYLKTCYTENATAAKKELIMHLALRKKLINFRKTERSDICIAKSIPAFQAPSFSKEMRLISNCNKLKLWTPDNNSDQIFATYNEKTLRLGAWDILKGLFAVELFQTQEDCEEAKNFVVLDGNCKFACISVNLK